MERNLGSIRFITLEKNKPRVSTKLQLKGVTWFSSEFRSSKSLRNPSSVGMLRYTPYNMMIRRIGTDRNHGSSQRCSLNGGFVPHIIRRKNGQCEKPHRREFAPPTPPYIILTSVTEPKLLNPLAKGESSSSSSSFGGAVRFLFQHIWFLWPLLRPSRSVCSGVVKCERPKIMRFWPRKER